MVIRGDVKITTVLSNERCKIKGPGLRFGKLYFLVDIRLSHFLSNRFLLAKLWWRGYSYSVSALRILFPSYSVQKATKMHPLGMCVVSTSFYSNDRTAGGGSTEEAAFCWPFCLQLHFLGDVHRLSDCYSIRSIGRCKYKTLIRWQIELLKCGVDLQCNCFSCR